MRSSQSHHAPPFNLASRSLRFRVLFGDETGFAVTQRVGIGGAIFKASIVPPVGSRIRLVERYAVPGAEAHIEAEVIAVTPEPTLDGAEPGFCAVFQRFTVRGPKAHLVGFLDQLEPGYFSAHHPDDIFGYDAMIETVEEKVRGSCTRFSPPIPFPSAPILRAAGLAETHADGWDEGLEEIDLGLEIDPGDTHEDPYTAHEAIRVLPTKPPPAEVTAPSPAPEPDRPPRRRGITGLLGRLFGRDRQGGGEDK